jgi:aspartate-semialdehyde dehydrogenase
MTKHIAIIGATGVVGTELLRIMEARGAGALDVIPLASARSRGQKVRFSGRELEVKEASVDARRGCELVFLAAGSSVSRAMQADLRATGAIVVDLSSAFRMAADVPLVVPEVNPEALKGHHGLLASPNCVATMLVMALNPLRRLAPLRRIVMSTYQAASGAGHAAMQELEQQTRDVLEGRAAVPRALPHPYAFNLFSHNSAIEAEGYNGEEIKVIEETRKIMALPDIGISVTCVRVPVMRAHTLSVNVEFDREVSPEDAERAMASAPGVKVVSDPAQNYFPMPLDATCRDEVLVGRIRRDPSCVRALNLFVCGDQLRKGAALNAVQIAELVVPGWPRDRGVA